MQYTIYSFVRLYQFSFSMETSARWFPLPRSDQIDAMGHDTAALKNELGLTDRATRDKMAEANKSDANI